VSFSTHALPGTSFRAAVVISSRSMVIFSSTRRSRRQTPERATTRA
jgi:hypothetical protein